MKKDHQYIYLYFVATLIFCYGFLLVLINGYYHYNYLHFIDIGRKDLIARLGFLAYATGFLFYPSVLIPVIILTYLSKRQQKIKNNLIWYYSFLAITFIGFLFYTETIDILSYRTMKNCIIGLILIIISIPMFWGKWLLNKFKNHHKESKHIIYFKNGKKITISQQWL